MSVLIENARILSLAGNFHTRYINISKGRFSPVIPNASTIDFENDYLVPGFIDLQVYGGQGKLFADEPGIESLEALVANAVEGGATTVIPTIATNSNEIMYKSIDAVKTFRQQGLLGIHGLHLEGPFINANKKGAHLESFIRKPQYKEVLDLLEYGKGIIKIITLAPECCEDSIIGLIQSYGVKISIGHSEASFAEAMHAFEKNINLVTHLFNAMPAMHHRKPGLATAAMLHPGAMASIVADGFHVNFEMITLAKKLMQERLFLITDAVTHSTGVYPHGLKDERYVLPNGTLSGSALTMMKAVQNSVQHANIPVAEAFLMASAYPAKALGLDAELGSIKEGLTADFLRVDEQLNIKAVYKAGSQVWPQ